MAVECAGLDRSRRLRACAIAGRRGSGRARRGRSLSCPGAGSLSSGAGCRTKSRAARNCLGAGAERAGRLGARRGHPRASAMPRGKRGLAGAFLGSELSGLGRVAEARPARSGLGRQAAPGGESSAGGSPLPRRAGQAPRIGRRAADRGGPARRGYAQPSGWPAAA